MVGGGGGRGEGGGEGGVGGKQGVEEEGQGMQRVAFPHYWYSHAIK